MPPGLFPFCIDIKEQRWVMSKILMCYSLTSECGNECVCLSWELSILKVESVRMGYRASLTFPYSPLYALINQAHQDFADVFWYCSQSAWFYGSFSQKISMFVATENYKNATKNSLKATPKKGFSIWKILWIKQVNLIYFKAYLLMYTWHLCVCCKSSNIADKDVLLFYLLVSLIPIQCVWCM